MATRKWGTEKLVNANLAGSQINSSVAQLVGGGFVIVWQDDSGADSVIFGQRYDAAGNKVGAEFSPSSFTGDLDDQIEPVVTGLVDGGFFVSWSDTDSATDHDITGAVFNASGGFVRTQISDGSGRDTEDAQVARLGTGSVSVWTNNSGVNDDVNFAIFDAAGNGGSIITANTATAAYQTNPSVSAAPDASKFAVVWGSNLDFTIKGRLFTPAGAELAPEFQIASAAGSLGVFEPVVAWLNDNEFAVVWREANLFNVGGNQIRVKIFDGQSATVVALTGSILVNSVMAGSQQNPCLTVLPNGGFVVSWEDTSGVGGDDGFAIKLQAFDGAGGKIGGEILVNTTTASSQFDPSIAALADGRVVVSWTDFSSGNEDVRMQIIDPRDGIVDGTAGSDTLYGNDVTDFIYGFDGADTVHGLAGADTINGGAGADNIFGDRGDDTSYGGSDGDRIYGDLGDDEQYGESGSDLIYSGAGSDLMDGGTGVGSDTAYYSSEKTGAIINLLDQSLNAGSALGDTLLNFELVFGSNVGADTITGGNGNETILGNGGADVLNGSGGADILRGGVGVDTLNGGVGADKFQYTALNEVGDVIITYEAVDDFQFTRAAFGNLAGANVAAVNFLSVASGHAATTVNHRFIFDQALDQLWYDADGSSAGAAVMVADLSNNINVTNLDLLLF